MDSVNQKINHIETKRRKYLFRLRVLSMAIVVAMLFTSILQGLNDFYEYSKNRIVLAVVAGFFGVLGVLFEYFVRWKVPMVEGVSEHLLEIRYHLENLHNIKKHYESMEKAPNFIPTIVTIVEIKKLNAKINEYGNRISFGESMNTVTAHSNISPRHGNQ